MSAPSISILMPAYRLVKTIGGNIERVVAVANQLGDAEVVVCDDGSDDGTAGAADEVALRYEHVTVVSNPVNRGKGGALKTAFAASTGETVVFLDGDLDLPPEQLPSFLQAFAESGTDVLVGAKRAAMARTDYPALRRILSLIYMSVVRLLFRLPVTETQTGLKVFKRSVLAPVLPGLSLERYTFDIELLGRIHRLGGRIDAAPVELGPEAAQGLSTGTLLEMARDTIRIWLHSFRWPRA